MEKDFQVRGIVEKIDHHCISVKILQRSACSSCHAKSVCLSSEQKTKQIEVTNFTGEYHVKEEVLVRAERTLGLQAVTLAFLIPLLLMIITLFLTILLWGNEIRGGLYGLLILVPYYHILYLNRDKLKRKFFFTLSKINS